MSADIIQARREKTADLLNQVREAFLEELGEERDRVLGTRTTVYVTGSCGRGDMGAASDLDPYVVSLGGRMSSGRSADFENSVDSALKTAIARVGLPELDAGGNYARLVSAESLTEHLGAKEDDNSDALTRRMLLLLESKPLINPAAYGELMTKVIDAYWKNEDQHPNDYLPIVLVNDIVRYWRILLLNHESNLLKKSRKQILSSEETMALRRYSSYKLRVPRCLSCFSALAYLLALTPTDRAHVRRDDIVHMADMTPIQRLEHLRANSIAPAETLDALRRLYVRYLQATDGGKTVLTDKLMADSDVVAEVSRDGRDFTRNMFDLIQKLGGGRTLHRAIVV